MKLGRLNNLASVPAVNQYLRYAESINIECEPLLVQAGIEPSRLSDNSKYISAARFEALLKSLIGASGEACFGLRSSSFVEPTSYSVLGYIALSCSSLRAIQANIPTFEKLVGDMGVTSIESSNGEALQRWTCSFNEPIVRRHATENVLGSWFNYSQKFVGPITCKAVWFEHSAPNTSELIEEYQALFGCPVYFNKPASGLLFDQAVLDQPLPQANEIMLATLLEHATTQLVELDQRETMRFKVKNLLRLMIKDQTLSSDAVARKLSISGRTLQRKLNVEGTQYKQVLNELRLELALHYLQKTEMSLEHISYELGFQEPRSFYRSFKSWTGRTAGWYRDQSLTKLNAKLN